MQNTTNSYPTANPDRETARGISNDQTATKAGRARQVLRYLLPHGATITAIQVNRHHTANGYNVFEFYVLITDPDSGEIVLINRELRALGFGVNRARGTIRSTDGLAHILGLIGTRVLGDPDAYRCNQIEPTLP